MHGHYEHFEDYFWGRDGTTGELVRRRLLPELMGDDGSDLMLPSQIPLVASLLKRSQTSLLLGTLIEADEFTSDRSTAVTSDLSDFVMQLLLGDQPAFVEDLFRDYTEMGRLPFRSTVVRTQSNPAEGAENEEGATD